MRKIHFNKKKTDQVLKTLQSYLNKELEGFTVYQKIAEEILGVHFDNEGSVLIGLYMPGLSRASTAYTAQNMQNSVNIRFLTAFDEFNFSAERNTEQHICFDIQRFGLTQYNSFFFGVYDNIKIGTKKDLGALYEFIYIDALSNRHTIRDPLAQSMPFGVMAAPELYDISSMLAQRKDMSYFTSHYKAIFPDASYRAKDIGSTLEIHVQTATKEGTLASLNRRYQSIAKKIRQNLQDKPSDPYFELSPDELNFLAYDSIELMPEVPQAERNSKGTGEFFQILQEKEDSISACLKKPDIQGWGYDVVIYGTAAVNASILESCRPDEFLEFIETLHTMPDKPIGIALDSVLGHADFQGGLLLRTWEQNNSGHTIKTIPSAYLKGANMYGRDVNYEDPVIRAILLEMYRRKNDFGIDAIRVDGGQDFVKGIDPVTGLKIQDDDFLHAMSTVVQNINGIKRRLDINIEDGRPWPDDLNWIYNSSYLCHVIDRYLPFNDRTKQWSPLIFAHNVHAKYKWFYTKWDKFKDVFKDGEHWITGNSTHDNARYFYRMVAPRPSTEYTPTNNFDDFYNADLSGTTTEVPFKALDNNALSAINLGILPGSPMFFLNTTFHTAWLFFRDVDDEYDLKVVADEGSRFMFWYLSEEQYSKKDNFKRLKEKGFVRREQLMNQAGKAGFLDRLADKLAEVKTETMMLLALYEEPANFGRYAKLKELCKDIEALENPQTQIEKRHAKKLLSRMAQKPEEVQRRYSFACSFIQEKLKQIEDAEHVKSRLKFLRDLSCSKAKVFQMLLEDSLMEGEYDPDTWAEDKELMALAPDALKVNGKLTGAALSSFAKDFMFDALELCNVENRKSLVNKDQAIFNFQLRKFRQSNPWLAKNPTNDVRLDFFNRNMCVNGAVHLGGWSDKGDIINANTIYYGWRSSPDKSKQVFLIANMEGPTLKKMPLRFLMHTSSEWTKVIQSPGMSVPDKIDKYYVIENFKNGQALILERKMTS